MTAQEKAEAGLPGGHIQTVAKMFTAVHTDQRPVWTCNRCAALTQDRDTHYAWHKGNDDD